jgi:ribosomal protein L11 methyltransferase
MPKKSSPPKTWIAEFGTMHSLTHYFMEALEHSADGVRAYEIVEDSGKWLINLYYNQHPDIGNLKSKIAELAIAVGVDAPEVIIKEAENKNWVEELAKEFKAIGTLHFHIYSEFSKASNHLINIRINPGMAFGTGQHETTYLCLEAIAHLADEDFKFKNILDLGCGSGILAIAAGKIWLDAKITATDNDTIAVRVAKENAKENQVELAAYASDSFAKIKTTKFDLILANILMNPLLEMAEDMAKFVNGMIILSGFKRAD